MVDRYANYQHWRAMLPIRQSGSEWSHFKVRKPKERVADLTYPLHQSVTKAQRNSNKGFRVHMTDLASRIKVEEFVRGKKGNGERECDHREGIIIKAFMLYSVLNCGLQKITLSVVWFNKAGFGGECIIGQEKKETIAIIPYPSRDNQSLRKYQHIQLDHASRYGCFMLNCKENKKKGVPKLVKVKILKQL